MHAHQFAWHNNELLDADSAQMVRFLSPERVTREGYVNLRCSWDPGCPEWLHPENTVQNDSKQEEILLAKSWSQLFPLDPIPTVLAQPCCAQFAVSRERILETNKMRYIYMRDWLLRTDLSDFLSGRVFEYIWQFIFSATPIYCPSEIACYCDGYGLCFETAGAYDEWLALWSVRSDINEQLRVWQEKADLIEEYEQLGRAGKMVFGTKLKAPEAGKDEELRRRIAKLEERMEAGKRQAQELGRDPKRRALAAGREWRDGDGF